MLLNQFTANILNIPVKSGPKEATAIGNLLVQALTLERVDDIVDLRQIVKNSFPIIDFTPKFTTTWNNAYTKYLQTIKL